MISDMLTLLQGAPYKYGVSVASRGFDEAPVAIIKALKRLTWAGDQALGDAREPFVPFNELLSIGYMENTAIGVCVSDMIRNKTNVILVS
jgi:hypothetical protein